MSSPPPRHNQDKMSNPHRQNSSPQKGPNKPNIQPASKNKSAPGPSVHVTNGAVPKQNGRLTAVAAYAAAVAPVPSSSSQSLGPAGRHLIFGSPSTSSAVKSKVSPVKMLSDVNNVIQIDDLPFEEQDQSQLLNGSTESIEEVTQINDLPENVLESLFTFLDLRDVVNASMVCLLWNHVISDENGDIWRILCLRDMDRETLSSDTLSSCTTFKSKLRAFYHAWNPHDCSRNIVVKPSGFTIHRNPVAQSTDGARGKIGFNRGRHAWEVKWEGPLGTVAVVGISTQHADLRAQGYIALIGRDDQSWGWNLVENILLHNGDSHGNYPLVNNAPRYQVGERIRVILDCEDNTLSFEKNEEFLGVAFRGLPQTEALYPAVSAVYGNSEISMVYLGPPLDG